MLPLRLRHLSVTTSDKRKKGLRRKIRRSPTGNEQLKFGRG